MTKQNEEHVISVKVTSEQLEYLESMESSLFNSLPKDVSGIVQKLSEVVKERKAAEDYCVKTFKNFSRVKCILLSQLGRSYLSFQVIYFLSFPKCPYHTGDKKLRRRNKRLRKRLGKENKKLRGLRVLLRKIKELNTEFSRRGWSATICEYPRPFGVELLKAFISSRVSTGDKIVYLHPDLEE